VTLSVMSEREAEGFKVLPEERRFHVRANNAKLNLAPPPDRAVWLRPHSIDLPNGDRVQAVVRWEAPTAWEGLSGTALLDVLREMNEAHQEVVQSIRMAVRDQKHSATCLGFGPRFLHSTGQAYKGGPNSGVFLQITCDDPVDLAVPGQRYSFGVVKAAQARGDFAVLAERGRRALRVHLKDLNLGLELLRSTVLQGLA